MTNKLILITGATSGLGAAFARKLASCGYDLIITGRLKEQLVAFANELAKQYKINVEVIICELSNEEDLIRLVDKVKTIKNLAMLINNAGFGNKNKFYNEDLCIWENMIKVHVSAMVRLTYAALPNMLANKYGSIINVSSCAAFLPLNHAVYNATKSFTSMFTEALSCELINTGVHVQTLVAPRLKETNFRARMQMREDESHRKWRFLKSMKPETVVDGSLWALKKNKTLFVPGFFYKIFIILIFLKRIFNKYRI